MEDKLELLLKILSNNQLNSKYVDSKNESLPVVATQLGKLFSGRSVDENNAIKIMVDTYGLEEEIVDLAMLYYGYSTKTMHLLDERNKYVTFFMDKKGEIKTKMGIVIREVFSADYYTGGILSPTFLVEYADYIKLEKEEREVFRRINNKKLGRKFHSYSIDENFKAILKNEKTAKVLKEKYDIKDFKIYFDAYMNHHNLSVLTTMLKTMGDNKEMVDCMESPDKYLKSAKDGSLLKANYYWKCLNYEPREVFASRLNEELEKMREMGSPSYVEFSNKVLKFVEKNPQTQKYLTTVQNIKNIDADLFMEEGFELLGFNLFVDSLQKLDKKLKKKPGSSNNYKVILDQRLRKFMGIEFMREYLNSTEVVLENSANVICVLFKYQENKNYSKNEVKKLYENILGDLVESDYKLESKIVEIKVQNFLMEIDNKSLPEASVKSSIIKM